MLRIWRRSKLPDPFIVLNVERIVDTGVVGAGDVDFVRVGVIDFTAESPAVLNTQAGLETVVVSVGVVLLLRDAAETRIGTILIGNRQGSRIDGRIASRVAWRVDLIASVLAIAVSTLSPGYQVGVEWEVVDVAANVLMPGEIADILNNQDDRRSQLILNAKAELRNRRRLEVLGECGASRREQRRSRRRAGYVADVEDRSSTRCWLMECWRTVQRWRRCRCRCPAAARRRFRSRHGERSCRFRRGLQRSRRGVAACCSRLFTSPAGVRSDLPDECRSDRTCLH